MSEQSPGPQRKPAPGWVRNAVDFGALVAFMGAFGILRLRGVESAEALVQATWVLMGASVIALAVGWFAERRLAPMPAIAGGFALVFGAMTLIFHDPALIKIKLTVQNAVIGSVLIGGVLLGRNPGKALLGSSIPLPDKAWNTLTLRYGAYFLGVAIINEIVWRTQSDDFWVLTFRPALWIAALVFAVAQVPFMMKHMAPPPETPESPDSGL